MALEAGALRRLFLHILLLILLLLPVGIIRESTMNPAVHSKELLARTLLCVAAVLVAFGAVRFRACMTLPIVALLAFIGANVLSCLFSGRVGFCFTRAWHLWGFMGLAVLLLYMRPSLAELRKIELVVLGAAAITAAYGLLVFFGADPLRRIYPFAFRSEEGRNYIHSFLGNPEYLGSYMAPVAVLALSMACRDRLSALARAGWTGLALCFLGAMLLSGTRGALIGFVVGAGVFLCTVYPRLSTRTRRGIAAIMAVGIVGGLAVFVVFSTPNPFNRRNVRLAQRFVQLFDVRSASVSERIFFSGVAGEMIADNPVFGGGPGSFRLDFYPAVERLQLRDEEQGRAGVRFMTGQLQRRVADHAHNDYLEIWCETGTVGFGLFALLLSVGVVRFFTGLRLDRDSATWSEVRQFAHIRAAWFCASSCVLINAAFSFPLHLPARSSLTWVMLGCFFAADEALRQLAPPGGTRESANAA